jgi:hypothetical protein
MHVLCGGLWANYLGLKERPSLASVQTLLSTFLNTLKGPSHEREWVVVDRSLDISRPAVTAKQNWLDKLTAYISIFFHAPY